MGIPSVSPVEWTLLIVAYITLSDHSIGNTPLWLGMLRNSPTQLWCLVKCTKKNVNYRCYSIVLIFYNSKMSI